MAVKILHIEDNPDNRRLVQRLFRKIQELEQANKALAESLQVQAGFLANVSHELKTPLGSILGVLELILDGLCEDPQEERAFLAEARGAAQELVAQINNLLDLAKLEAGTLRIEAEPVDLGGLFEEIQALFRAQAGAKGLTLTLEPPEPAFGVIRADPDRLRQVLVNLVGNSLKFTERGGITVRTQAGPEEGFATIEVADTGIGIPPEWQARLLMGLAQAEESTTGGPCGAGLGLAVSKRLVEMMGGVLALESRGEGWGTTVTLRLPFSREPARTPPDTEGARAGKIRPVREAPLILIVEDNPTFREVLEDLLQSAGFQTTAVSGADEALDIASRLHPGILITDLSLSGPKSAGLRTGVDLVAAVMRRPDLQNLGVILLTGDRARALTLLRDLEVPVSLPILGKPVRIDDLLAAIEAVLARGLREVGV